MLEDMRNIMEINNNATRNIPNVSRMEDNESTVYNTNLNLSVYPLRSRSRRAKHRLTRKTHA